ncbi:MAG TPA: heterodisulfide reductase-related iron-sulfur binding cluster [Acidimicrobiales bacterium]|nr:heterodisulfide reductase-related iron-sulfur binding cluster [Acidimicrobiales bacterium]
MTTTYDPFHPKYFDEPDVREELTRVYDICHGCRLCFKFCTSFPTLFSFVDELPDQDAEKLTPAQQDQVVDECFQCKLCYVNCPYIPGQHEWAVDFPRLMMRADQVRRRNEKRSVRTKLTDAALSKTDFVGKVNTRTAPLSNIAIGKPESFRRKIIEKTVGIASERVLPPYTRQRFTTWFRKRGGSKLARAKQGSVTLFPTCLVEYQNVGVGHDTVKVYERNGIECTVPGGLSCCGAPALHQGDVDTFRELGRKNVAALARAVRDGDAAGDDVRIVVPQPTCSYILKKDYVDYIGGADAELVASRTRDVAEYLWEVHKGEGTEFDTTFAGEVPATTTYHAPCHLRAQNIGLKSRDLLKLTGTKLTLVAECSGIDGTWGMRAENLEISRGVAKKMADAMARADSETIAGDCTLANGGIVLETGRIPLHPMQQLARAYGIDEEGEAIDQRARITKEIRT